MFLTASTLSINTQMNYLFPSLLLKENTIQATNVLHLQFGQKFKECIDKQPILSILPYGYMFEEDSSTSLH